MVFFTLRPLYTLYLLNRRVGRPVAGLNKEEKIKICLLPEIEILFFCLPARNLDTMLTAILRRHFVVQITYMKSTFYDCRIKMCGMSFEIHDRKVILQKEDERKVNEFAMYKYIYICIYMN